MFVHRATSTTVRPIDRRIRRALVVGALGLGAALRLLFLHRSGVDLGQDAGWANAVLAKGLLRAYTGDYYPVQWAIFGGADSISRTAGLSFAEVEKLITVAFDFMNLGLIAVLLRRWQVPLGWMFFYWLNPYFLVIDWNGYADPQTTFFALAAIAVLGSQPKIARSVAAGGLFAIALLMKPQALVLALLVVAYAVARILLNRGWDERSRAALAIVGPSLLAGLLWSIAFALAGRGALLLAHTYLSPSRANLAISVYFPNVWYPLKALYSLTLHTGFILRRPLFFYGAAVVFDAALLLWVVLTVARSASSWRWDDTILVLFACGAGIQPMVFAAAHENHFFLAAVFVSLLCLRLRSTPGFVAITAALLVQTLNLLGGFGLGGSPRSAPQPILWLVDRYSPELLVMLAIANVAAVSAAAVAIARRFGTLSGETLGAQNLKTRESVAAVPGGGGRK